DAAERLAFRKPSRSAGLSGPLGRALGRHAHSRHHQASGRGDVRRRAAGAVAVARRTLSLLLVWRTHRASGWLCGGGSGVLQRTAWLGGSARAGAVGPSIRSTTRSAQWSVAAGTSSRQA